MNSSSWLDSLDLNNSANSLQLETLKDKLIVFGRELSVKEESDALMKELNRANEENKKLTEMLTAMCESYNALQSQLIGLTSKNDSEKELSPTKKRKSENNINDNNNFGIINGNSESSSTREESCKKPREDETIETKISRAYVRTEPSDHTSHVVKDGYQWRKYGQKVTRDNPSPRAYFKCSFAPSCPVKKKVQRSVDDQLVLVATYEGEHNHLPPPPQMEAASGSSRCASLGSVPVKSSGPNVTLNLTKSKSSSDHEARRSKPSKSSSDEARRSKPSKSSSDEARRSKPSKSSSDEARRSKPSKSSTDEGRRSKAKMDSAEARQYLVEQMASSLTKDPNFTAALVAAISGRMFSTKSN